MERQFYSYRRGRREPLSGPFFTAYEAMLERLIRELQLSKYFIDYPDDSFDSSPAEARLKELIGTPWTPLGYYRNIIKPKEEAQVLDVIEAFRELSSKQRSYEREVNILFERFNHPYRLDKGVVRRQESEVLEKIWGDTIRSTDETLIKYIKGAVDSFFYAKEDRRLEGLRSLYDAYERLKSSLAAEKKKSSLELIEQVFPEPLRDYFNSILAALTNIGNQANIRHSEHRVTIIDHDPELINFLFYTVYALIKAALHKLTADQ